MSNSDRELDHILSILFHSYDARGNQLAINEAKAAIQQKIEAEYVRKDAPVQIKTHFTTDGRGWVHADDVVKLVKRGVAQELEQRCREARLAEISDFEPLQRDHSACFDSHSCIGYQNAASDFDNEKQIRINALSPSHPPKEEIK